MVRYVLDSDHISLIQRGNTLVGSRVMQNLPDLAIAIISVQEIFNGWAGRLNRSDREAQKIVDYTKLRQTVEFVKLLDVLNYDENASQTYLRLIQNNPELGKRRIDKDVRIAAIALTQNAIVVTRNRKDFGLVPGLQLEDWSV